MFANNEHYFIELGDTVKIVDTDVSYYNKSPLRYRKGFYCNNNEECFDFDLIPVMLIFDKALSICYPCRILLVERFDKKRPLHDTVKPNKKIVYK